MELNQNIWYVRLFFWSLGIWSAFCDDYYIYDRRRVEERGTNLCFFVRVTVVYVPLVILLNIALVVAAIASLTALPIYLFGGARYGWALAAIAVFIGIIWGSSVILRSVIPRKRVEPSKELAPAVAGEPKGPNFWAVLWAYFVAVKKKVCPLVTFRSIDEAH